MSDQYLKYLQPNVKLPDDLEKLAISVVGNTEDYQVKYSGKYSNTFQVHVLPAPVISWIKQNIQVPSDLIDDDFRIHIIHPGLRIHSDYGRSWALNYLLDAGGSLSESVWYDDTKTTKLYGEIIPPRTWHIFNTEFQHTVENIDVDKLRIAITVTYEKKLMPEKIKIY